MVRDFKKTINTRKMSLKYPRLDLLEEIKINLLFSCIILYTICPNVNSNLPIAWAVAWYNTR